MTEPIIAASSTLTPSRRGARMTVPTISKVAGTKHSSTADRPTLRRSPMSRLRPARVRIMMSAILRRSAEIASRLSSSNPSAYGPKAMPTSSIPNSGGKRNRLKTSPASNPPRKTSAKLHNILLFSSLHRQKELTTPAKIVAEVISSRHSSGFGAKAAGDIHSLGCYHSTRTPVCQSLFFRSSIW